MVDARVEDPSAVLSELVVSFFGAIVEQGLLGKDRDAEALNNPVPVDDLAYLRKYDSTQRRFSGEVTVLKHSAER
jgi:glyceraldehyde 3-phosphate dehydrogenase